MNWLVGLAGLWLPGSRACSSVLRLLVIGAARGSSGAVSWKKPPAAERLSVVAHRSSNLPRDRIPAVGLVDQHRDFIADVVGVFFRGLCLPVVRHVQPGYGRCFPGRRVPACSP